MMWESLSFMTKMYSYYLSINFNVEKQKFTQEKSACNHFPQMSSRTPMTNQILRFVMSASQASVFRNIKPKIMHKLFMGVSKVS